jgi:hypothetical protein
VYVSQESRDRNVQYVQVIIRSLDLLVVSLVSFTIAHALPLQLLVIRNESEMLV